MTRRPAVPQCRNRVVLFVRAPRLGAVKTRLGREIGMLAAWRFYRITLLALCRRLGADPRWRLELAVTPDRFALTRGMFPAGLPQRRQGAGDLGARMARAMRGRRGERLLVIGSDIPGIDRGAIWRAFRALDRNALVFGPATDGGYWLVGARAGGLPPGAFRGVRWSTPHALGDSIASLPRQRRVGLVDCLRDVDSLADLQALRRQASPRTPTVAEC